MKLINPEKSDLTGAVGKSDKISKVSRFHEADKIHPITVLLTFSF